MLLKFAPRWIFKFKNYVLALDMNNELWWCYEFITILLRVYLQFIQSLFRVYNEFRGVYLEFITSLLPRNVSANLFNLTALNFLAV